MKRFSRIFLMVALCVAPLWAQQASTNDVPATKEDVETLFTTMHIREQMGNIMQVAIKQQKQMIRVAVKQKIPDIQPKDLDRIDAMMDESIKSLDVNGMIDDMIPVYQRHLSKTDVAAMTTFYQSPTGQKMIREQPQMTAEAMQATQPRLQKAMTRMMDEAEKMAKDAAAEKQNASEKN